jgi:signal transduction histidine kinase
MISARGTTERSRVFILTAPAGRSERRLALIVVLISLGSFLLALPFVRVPLARLPAFIPGYEAALEINDLVTTVMLLGLFTRVRSRALLTLALGYLFDALMMIPHAMTFPGVFTETGLLGAGPQTTAWIYMFWHTGFPLFVVAYTLLRRRSGDEMTAPLVPTIAIGIVAVAILAVLLTALATAGHDRLPILIQGGDYSLSVSQGVGPSVWAICIAVLGLMLWRLRPMSVLDLWLIVVMCAWVFDTGLSAVFGSARYDLGFYAGRSYGLLAASFVLAVLLLESNRLYGRLADALGEAEAYNTELERSRDELARAQRMEAIGQITGGIAHDFNNLLTIVIGNLAFAIEHVADKDPPLHGYLSVAMRGAQRGARITAQLLATARRQRLAPEPLDLAAAMLGMRDLLSTALGSAFTLDIEIPARLANAIADAAQLEVAILNLIVNCRDAFAATGTVTITAREVALSTQDAARRGIEPGRYVVLAVADDGPGMPAEVAARAFEPFFTTKGMATSSGLGLSQVYGFARQSGGTCVIDSTLGKGTTVSIYLPAIGAAATDLPAAEAPAAARPGAEFGARIILVEDDTDVREYLVRFLEKVGFKVIAASNGLQALAMLEQSGQVDVLCTDIVMPGGLSGYDVARRAREFQPDLKVIFMSGYSDRTRMPANGNSPFLAKPFLGNELVETVRLVIG